MSDLPPIEMPQPLGLFAGELFDRGKEYLAAFRHLSEAMPELKFPGYFLLCHSVEIILKAFLAANGIKKTELQSRRLGHKLSSLFEECEKHNIPNVDNLKALSFHLNEMNRDNDFRYPTGYRLSVPKPTDCIAVVGELVAAIDSMILKARFDAQLDHASETRHLKDESGSLRKIRWSD